MDTKQVIKSLLISGLFVGSILLASYQFFKPKYQTIYTAPDNSPNSFGWKFPVAHFQSGNGQVTDLSAYSELRAKGIPSGLPVRLKIPIIGVNTLIEDAKITPDGRMDVPENSVNVAWFALGPPPGQIGNSVIGGHYGIDNGKPKVFYNLNKLKKNDSVLIIDDFGKTITFKVRDIKIFDRNADATSVFISNDQRPHLNLIACDGIWNKINDTYPDRRVVFTDLVATDENQNLITTEEPDTNPRLPETALPSNSNAGKQIDFLFTTPKNIIYSVIIFTFLSVILIKIITRK